MSATLRKSSLSPPGGFHTQVSAPHVSVTCNRVEQTLSTQLYFARLTRQKKRKGLQVYARLSGLWVIASAENITKRASLYLILLAVTISPLPNHSR